jgi:hypothetical protein
LGPGLLAVLAQTERNKSLLLLFFRKEDSSLLRLLQVGGSGRRGPYRPSGDTVIGQVSAGTGGWAAEDRRKGFTQMKKGDGGG